jgi:hypothetical protein
MKFKVEEASNRWGEAKEVKIRTLKGLKRFAEKEFKGREDMFDGSQEIIVSFKKKRIIIYDDYIE